MPRHQCTQQPIRSGPILAFYTSKASLARPYRCQRTQQKHVNVMPNPYHIRQKVGLLQIDFSTGKILKIFSPRSGIRMRRREATPQMRRAGMLALPGPLYRTAPSTIIMHGIMGAPNTCHSTCFIRSSCTASAYRFLSFHCSFCLDAHTLLRDCQGLTPATHRGSCTNIQNPNHPVTAVHVSTSIAYIASHAQPKTLDCGGQAATRAAMCVFA